MSVPTHAQIPVAYTAEPARAASFVRDGEDGFTVWTVPLEAFDDLDAWLATRAVVMVNREHGTAALVVMREPAIQVGNMHESLEGQPDGEEQA